MGNAAVVAWAGVLQAWGSRSGAGGALAAVPSDRSHGAVLSSEGGFIAASAQIDNYVSSLHLWSKVLAFWCMVRSNF